MKGFISTPYKVVLIRLFCLSIMIVNFTSSIISNETHFENVKFLTRWGVWFTNSVIILGLMHTPYKYVRKFDEHTYWQRYTPFALWKWYILLYQYILVSEVIITIVFWTALWGYMSQTPEHKGHPVAMLNLITDHSAPLFVMLLDFFTVSTVPFCRRHLIGIMALLFCYLMTNLSFQLATGEPVYGPLSWTTLGGIIGIFVCLFAAVLIFFLLMILTKWKFKKLGHDQMILIM